MSNYSKEEILAFIEAKNLPNDFSQWEFGLEDGLTVAHVAGVHGLLPRGFSKWEILDSEGWTVAHRCAQAGTIRPGFRQWDLQGPSGRTVAHEAAKYGHLPEGFQLWAIHDGEDWTVAHEAASCGTLPQGFDHWLLDKNIWSVAHEAAENGHLFDVLGTSLKRPFRLILETKDGNGASVAWVALDAGHPIPDRFMFPGLWRIGERTPYSVAHVAAVNGLLPKNFSDWDVLDEEGATVAHTAAMHGTLPRKFKDWDLRDTSGWTVLEIAEEYGHYSFAQLLKDRQFEDAMSSLENSGVLPEGFTALDVCDDNGFTIAHEAAYRGCLPEGFDGWHWADKKGRTVAHEAASAGLLPEGFDQWNLADENGWTVAHTAAQHAFDSANPVHIQAVANQIPKEMWDVKDNLEGFSVGSFFEDLPDSKPQTPKL